MIRKNIQSFVVVWIFLIFSALACKLLSPSTAVPSPTQTATIPLPTSVVLGDNLPFPTSVVLGDNLPSEDCVENQGKIVFSYDPREIDAVNYGIYLMDSDGGNRIRLSAPDTRSDTHPAWSPDHCWIAFSRSVKGNDDIYVMSADGKTIHQLTTDPADDIFPDWSPDGRQISFISYREDGYRNLFVMNADGSDQRRLTDEQMLPKNRKGYVQWQQWSPKGDEIAFTYNPGDNQGPSIYVIRPDGSGLRQVSPRGMEPAWSIDGTIIFFLDSAGPTLPGVEIWAIHQDGSGIKKISNFGGVVVYPDHSLRVSPDGNWLAFYGVGPEVTEYGNEIYVIHVDGSGFKNISNAKGQDEWLDW